ncbi:MAG: hypothetical protein V3T05_08110, partial [Myxococcota bacterium]
MPDDSKNLRDRGPPRAVQRETKDELLARLEELATKVDQTRADEGFVAMLSGIARIWRYSILNHMMILRQRSSSTSVNGEKQWAKLGRTIKEGEVGMIVTAPSGTRGRFVWVPVFDVEQTDGPPIPKLELVDGECSHVADIEAAAEHLGIAIKSLNHEAHSLPASVVGLSIGGTIYVKEGLSPLGRARTLVHELCHELLHHDRFLEKRAYKGRPRVSVRPPRKTREAEADAAAFVVMGALGYPIDTPTYVAWMGADSSIIYASLKRIHATATG